ncbi:hypothetical protein HMPREF0534_0093 [Limosilactobacillus reuteri CF48-3A]|uniref:Siphovirus-type tail component RIFT-related domain-containing protein n=3 Tax=Bacteria TaxID=2 RepID=F8DPZ1_LIMRS|nr:hypothetical protein HMPREF0538_22112 [Limosilactobacillus reuteri SD2112]EEI66602.1 hypothetical protein HMPREF0534_0093 [Limosilactobacillus reuteri CF48-3A]PIN30466.1 phage tail family protein [Limosilactobacillus reuteri]PUH35020.1 phage tail family protein [Limosilactobacillus reuteri]PUH35168.1 phage tail family protein [Limosilactobacillus reuteri]
MVGIAVNVLYIKLDDQKEVASTDITDHLTFLGLSEGPSLSNNYRDDTLEDGQVWNYSRYVQTTVTAKFLLQFIDRRDFKMAKHEIYRVLAQKGIYRLRTGVEPDIVRYCRAGSFEIKSDPEEVNYCTFEVPFENPSGMRFSKLHSDEMKDEDFLDLNMNMDENTPSYHFKGQNKFTVYNDSDITIDPVQQHHDFKITMKHNGGKFTIKNETTNTSWTYNKNVAGTDTLVLQGRKLEKNNNFDSANTDYGYITLAPGPNQFTVTGADDLDITFSFPFIYLG